MTERSYDVNGERKFITEIVVNIIDYLTTSKEVNTDTTDTKEATTTSQSSTETKLADLIASF